MPANVYRFVTHWRLPGTPDEVSDLLGDLDLLCRIWPSLYRRARVVEPGDDRDVGKVVKVLTRGHLPYTLRWAYRVTESRRPYGYSIVAWGDLEGSGVWTLEADGSDTRLRYDWQVRAEKPLLKWLSPVLKPLFALNHDRVMAEGEAALRRELEQRHRAR